LKITYALSAIAIAAMAGFVALAVRLDYAHRWRSEPANMCGPGLITCPDGETCAFDDYSHAIPIGHCEEPCFVEKKTCSRTSAPRQCRFTDDEPATLECVRVYHY
jgi:hypothetical protein